MIAALKIGPIGANGLAITGIDPSRPIDDALARDCQVYLGGTSDGV